MWDVTLLSNETGPLPVSVRQEYLRKQYIPPSKSNEASFLKLYQLGHFLVEDTNPEWM